MTTRSGAGAPGRRWPSGSTRRGRPGSRVRHDPRTPPHDPPTPSPTPSRRGRAPDVRHGPAHRAPRPTGRPPAAHGLDGNGVRGRAGGGGRDRPADHRRPGGGARRRRTAGAPGRRRRRATRWPPSTPAMQLARRLRRGGGHRHGAAVAGGRAGRPAAGDRCPRRRAEDGAEALGALLDAQRFTAGLGVLEPGTLTNNTDDAAAGWSSADVGSLAHPTARPPTPRTMPCPRALGLADTHCWACRAPTADGDDALVTAVSRTLWPATWGYWLTQFVGLGVGGLDRDDCDWAREHAARFVRPGGPLPTLRVGRQPYGLLPIDGAHPVPGRRPRDPARRDRRRPDRDGLAAGARQGGTGRARRPGRGPRRRAPARRPVRRRVAAPRPRLDVRRQRPRLPRRAACRSRRGARSRPAPSR